MRIRVSYRSKSVPLNRTLQLLCCVFLSMMVCNAQSQSRIITPTQQQNIVPAVLPNPTSIKIVSAASIAINFNAVAFGSVGLQGIKLPPNNSILRVDIKDNSGVPSSQYMYEYSDAATGAYCDSAKRPCDALVVGFMPSDDNATTSATMVVTMMDNAKVISTQLFNLTGRGAKTSCFLSPTHKLMPLNRPILLEEIYGIVPPTVEIKQDVADHIYEDFGNPLKKLLVNCYYSTNTSLSYFNQLQSIYNAASGSTTLNANLASLNFVNGMQLTLAANPQIGSSTTEASVPSGITAGVPTLLATSAAQAAQNILNGGTLQGSAMLPLFFYPPNGISNGQAILSAMVTQGIDFQTFNNTSTTANNPSTHTFVGLETYLQYSAINKAPNSTDPAGLIFFGGKYGYALANHSYSLENGFGGRVNFQLAQVGAGILVNNVVKIAAYRGFGPSQKFIDSTTNVQKNVNNFQTWSFAIAYQSSAKK